MSHRVNKPLHNKVMLYHFVSFFPFIYYKITVDVLT